MLTFAMLTFAFGPTVLTFAFRPTVLTFAFGPGLLAIGLGTRPLTFGLERDAGTTRPISILTLFVGACRHPERHDHYGGHRKPPASLLPHNLISPYAREHAARLASIAILQVETK